ncbi:MAG: phosphoribosyl-ATP diphosphatase [Pseudomonadota bacterium]
MSQFSLFDLEEIVAKRAAASPDESWTASLLSKGVGKAAEKFGEEAVETVIAAVSQSDAEVVKEASDTLFHLLVVLKARDIPLASVMAELESRTTQSGIQEKKARG